MTQKFLRHLDSKNNNIKNTIKQGAVMVVKKKKKKPSRMDEDEVKAEVDTDTDAVEAEVEVDETGKGNVVVQVKVDSVTEFGEQLEEGSDYGVTTQFIASDTKEIVCTRIALSTKIMFVIDPSSWAQKIADELWSFDGEGQDPETIDVENDGYEFVMEADYGD